MSLRSFLLALKFSLSRQLWIGHANARSPLDFNFQGRMKAPIRVPPRLTHQAPQAYGQNQGQSPVGGTLDDRT